MSSYDARVDKFGRIGGPRFIPFGGASEAAPTGKEKPTPRMKAKAARWYAKQQRVQHPHAPEPEPVRVRRVAPNPSARIPGRSVDQISVRGPNGGRIMTTSIPTREGRSTAQTQDVYEETQPHRPTVKHGSDFDQADAEHSRTHLPNKAALSAEAESIERDLNSAARDAEVKKRVAVARKAEAANREAAKNSRQGRVPRGPASRLGKYQYGTRAPLRAGIDYSTVSPSDVPVEKSPAEWARLHKRKAERLAREAKVKADVERADAAARARLRQFVTPRDVMDQYGDKGDKAEGKQKLLEYKIARAQGRAGKGRVGTTTTNRGIPRTTYPSQPVGNTRGVRSVRGVGRGLGAFGLLTGPITAGAELLAAKKYNKPYSLDDFMKALLGLPNGGTEAPSA